VPGRAIAIPPVPISGQRTIVSQFSADHFNFHTLIGTPPRLEVTCELACLCRGAFIERVSTGLASLRSHFIVRREKFEKVFPHELGLTCCLESESMQR
jgi:hypothetical protein